MRTKEAKPIFRRRLALGICLYIRVYLATRCELATLYRLAFVVSIDLLYPFAAQFCATIMRRAFAHPILVASQVLRPLGPLASSTTTTTRLRAATCHRTDLLEVG